MGSRFGQINMPAFGQQGADARRDQGVATGHGHLAEGAGAGAGLSGRGAGHAGPAFPLPAGVVNAGHLMILKTTVM